MKILSRLFYAGCLALVLAGAPGCAPTPKSEGTGGYLDDSAITTKVKAALLNTPDVSSTDINVETFKGVVQLSGFANSKSEIRRAVEVARTVAGVISVKNDIRLK